LLDVVKVKGDNHKTNKYTSKRYWRETRCSVSWFKKDNYRDATVYKMEVDILAKVQNIETYPKSCVSLYFGKNSDATI